MTVSAEDRARRIKIIIFDVDGVLTDGTIWIYPMPVALPDGRISETVALRARDLKMEFVYQGQVFKMKAIRDIMQKEGTTLEEIAYVGDDVIDLPVMRECGLAVAVANARAQVKAEAHYVTPNAGGEGAGRDAIEFILKAKGLLEQCIEASIDENNPMPSSMDIGKGGDLK